MHLTQVCYPIAFTTIQIFVEQVNELMYMIIEHNYRSEIAQIKEMCSKLRNSRNNLQPLSPTPATVVVSTEPRDYYLST